MKKFILISCLILQSNLSFSIPGWIESPVITDNVLRSIYFIDSNTGFVCGSNGSIFKTTDGGNIWLPGNSPGIGNFQNIYFIDNQRGLLTTVPMPSEAGYWFVIFLTTNQGSSWVQILQGGNFITDFYIDSSEFFLSLDGVLGFETTGGIIFSQVNLIHFNPLPYFDFFRNSGVKSVCKNNDRIWISASYGDDVGTDVNRLGYTTNYGLNWQIVMLDSAVLWNEPPSHNKFFNIRFVNDSVAYLSSKLGLMKTENEGADWFILDTTITKNVQKNYFTSADTGWIFKSNKIYKTTSGGVNWDTNFIYTSNFTQPFFLNSLTGYILCDNRRILKTINGGIVSVKNSGNQNVPDKFSLSQNFPNPFNPLTIINYQLAINNVVSLKVYDALGKEVVTLVNEKQDPGRYSVEFSGEGLPSGVYYYKLEAEDFTETKRMILLK